MRNRKLRTERLKKMYPFGSRVVLDSMDDPQAPPEGTQGTVTGVDDMGTIHVRWDTGSGLGVCPDGGDSAHRIASEDEYKVTLDHFGKFGTLMKACPRCGKQGEWLTVHHALSRRAKIEVCSTCGMVEAVEDFKGMRSPLADWMLIKVEKDM